MRSRIHHCWRVAAAAVLATAAHAALAQSDPPYSDAVAARFPAPAAHYGTPALAPGRTAFTDNSELARFLDQVVSRGSARSILAGRSSTGLPIMALHFSRAEGRPVALLLGQQHGNEPAGAEALLAIIDALADERSALSSVLDRLDVVVLPRVNPDGAALSRRMNALGVDPNRDHLLLDTPEAAAVAQLAWRFDPVLVVDLHEHLALAGRSTDHRGVARHDLLLQFATTPNMAPMLAEIADPWFRLPLLTALGVEGLSAEWYHVRSSTPGHLAMGGLHPALARNAFGLRHAVSVLLESRGLDLGRLHFERRVHSHVVAVSSLLRSAAEHLEALLERRSEAREAVRTMACSGPLVIESRMTRSRREWRVIDPESGADKTVEIEWDSALALVPVVARTRPCGYWLSASATVAADRLRALGVKVEALAAQSVLEVETYLPAARDGDAPPRVSVVLRAQSMEVTAGAHYVPMDQPLAGLIAAALEPDSGHSYVAHRLLALDQVARVLKAP